MVLTKHQMRVQINPLIAKLHTHQNRAESRTLLKVKLAKIE